MTVKSTPSPASPRYWCQWLAGKKIEIWGFSRRVAEIYREHPKMDAAAAAKRMLTQLEREGCIYQDDVVDPLVKGK